MVLDKPLDGPNVDTFAPGGQISHPIIDGSHRSGVKAWQKLKPNIEILCNNQASFHNLLIFFVVKPSYPRNSFSRLLSILVNGLLDVFHHYEMNKTYFFVYIYFFILFVSALKLKRLFYVSFFLDILVNSCINFIPGFMFQFFN